MSENPLRALPSVDRLLAHPDIQALHGDGLARDIARETLDALRSRVAAGEPPPPFEGIVEDVVRRLHEQLVPPLRPLINATGVILHTNLGRAPLAPEAIAAMEDASRGYSDLEYDLDTGARGSRHTVLEPLLCRITGAEAAMAVNNNAAAVLLALSALAAGREVVVSRGQLVEIGGGFRIPDVMRQSRAKLIEVGTTNRTRAADFADAIGPKTAAVMRVHASNFKIVGFTESPSLEQLAVVAHDHDVLLFDDLGSGCLLDTTKYGLPQEPTPQASIAAGADVVMFSGDKLIGGPQGGLIVGRREPMEKMKRHPLARAVRLDKASIAGLAATLRLYLDGTAEAKLPVWRMMGADRDDLERRAQAVAVVAGATATVIEGRSMVGGGSLPEEGLATWLVAVRAPSGVPVAALASSLRAGGVVGRVERGRLLLDVRTVDPAEDERLGRALAEALRPPEG